MHLIPIGGLCNRLRTICSHLEWCQQNGGEALHVYWLPHVACASRFSELFETDGLEAAGIVLHDGRLPSPNVGPVIQTCSVRAGVEEAVWGARAAAILRPVTAIQARIDGLLERLGTGFTALHIRRTDHNANYDQDEVFASFGAAGEGAVYAASDNPRSLATLKRALGGRLLYNGRFRQTGIRLTDVADAVVDLWVCASSARFRGTFYSSFSDWIEMIRSLRGAAAGDLSKIL